MLDIKHLNELSRIITEIKNIDKNKVPHWITGFRQKLFYIFSDPNTCIRVTFLDTGNIRINLICQRHDSTFVDKLEVTTGVLHGISEIYHDKYRSNGFYPLCYNGQKSKDIDKADYFNQMIMNPDVPDYRYIEFAPEVDMFFINNEINGKLCYTISTVDLKRISFKQYI